VNKKLTPIERWCWYLAIVFVAIAWVAQDLPLWLRISLTVGMLWSTRVAQVDTRRNLRLAARKAVR
jgi:hypothetical protein